MQIETHVAGERVRYFEDDDGMDLREMVRREKMSTAEDQNALYSRMAGRVSFSALAWQLQQSYLYSQYSTFFSCVDFIGSKLAIRTHLQPATSNGPLSIC